MEPLSSLKNPRVKRVVKLRQRRARDQERAFLVEGYREILRASERRFPLEELFVCSDFFLGENEEALIERVRQDCGAEVCPVASHVFEKLSYRDRPDGLLAVAPQPTWRLGDLPRETAPLYVVATAIEKPGNLGTILRSADAVGVSGVIVCDPVTDIFNPNVVRASVGTLFTVPVATATSEELRPWLRDRGVRSVATTPAATVDYSSANLTGPCAIVLGSEQYGLPDDWLNQTDIQLRIPMAGRADSINVAMAATVMMFEARRQRGA